MSRIKRKTALAIIVADVAENGKATRIALRAYVENRVSRAAFNEACETGMRIYERRKATEQAHDRA